MKSKQLNFFITPEDHEEINEFMFQKDIYAVTDKYIQNDENPIKKIPDMKAKIFQIYFLRKEDFDSLKTLSTKNNIFYFDNLTSPLLEFSLGGFYPYDKNLLQRARFYYIKGFYENGTFVDKADDFLEWSDSIIKDFKKRFLKRYSKGDGFWYSESSIRWIEEHKAVLINGGQQWEGKI
ncbi:hypothetical protein H8B06_20475 [Sphingobacterium sp. DN00404]|uniref:Uncharacterized protein n=1 Tax=Sphingobacterium micropteri TaxID=2763501 RepID=A0ABR7YV29_9SPHI|nr:hypothetical protein [Sphingobacterium micropteri]MBD1435206.1 hypothetical protein [Sphingobacterium micropteri]